MKNSISVHVFDGLEQLVYVELDAWLRQVGGSTFDSFIEIHLHELKDES